MKLKPFIVCVAVMLHLCAWTDCILAKSLDVVVIRSGFDSRPLATSGDYTQGILQGCSSYFREQLPEDSQISFSLSLFDVTLPSEDSTKSVSAQIIDACRLSDAKVDFSLNDSDADGYVDAVCVVFPEGSIWPREYSLSKDGKSAVFDGTKIDLYIAVPEIFIDSLSSIDVWCHEFCHLLGLKDLYDSDSEGSSGVSEALCNCLSPMDFLPGTFLPNFSCVDYDLINVGQRDTLYAGDYRLSPLHDCRRYLFYPTATSGEYFLLECRDNVGRDSVLRRGGLAVYHIDKSQNRSGFSSFYGITLTSFQRWEYGEINCRPDHQCADLLEACPDASSVMDLLFPLKDSQNLSSDTEPSFRSWDGEPLPLALMDISMDGKDVIFTAIEPLSIVKENLYQDAAFLQFRVDPYLWPSMDSLYLTLDNCSYSKAFSPDNEGYVFCTISGLEPGCRYSCSATLHCTDGCAFSIAHSFSTMVYDSRNSMPFIYLNDAVRNSDGSFSKGTEIALHVYNLVEGETVRWYFNGVPVNSESLSLSDSGKLVAEIFYDDGSSEVIVKEIRVIPDGL